MDEGKFEMRFTRWVRLWGLTIGRQMECCYHRQERQGRTSGGLDGPARSNSVVTLG